MVQDNHWRSESGDPKPARVPRTTGGWASSILHIKQQPRRRFSSTDLTACQLSPTMLPCPSNNSSETSLAVLHACTGAQMAMVRVQKAYSSVARVLQSSTEHIATQVLRRHHYSKCPIADSCLKSFSCQIPTVTKGSNLNLDHDGRSGFPGGRGRRKAATNARHQLTCTCIRMSKAFSHPGGHTASSPPPMSKQHTDLPHLGR